MSRTSSSFTTMARRVAGASIAAALAVLAACGGDSPINGPIGTGNQTIAVALAANTASVRQGETFTTNVNVTRGGEYAGTVDLTVEGLPAGVTASFTPSQLGATGTASVLTLATTDQAPLGAFAVLVKGSGIGVTEAKAALQVTVNPKAQVPVATVTIAPVLDTLEAYDVVPMPVVLRDSANQPLAGRTVRWSSSNPAVATIDSATGVLTGVDRGTVTITATSEGKIGTATRVVVIKYRSLSAGTMHACDLASGGIAWCWGLNGNEGRIGSATLGANAYSDVPVRVPGNLRFTRLSTYGRTTCALTAQGDAWCWGYNGWGALGAGSNAGMSITPLKVAGNLTFRDISVGGDHACGVTTTNQGYCWGNNDWRQLGTGNSTVAGTPVAIAGNLAFSTIAAGSSATCGVTVNGEAWCWGANSIGRAGDGGTINYGNVFVSQPQRVVGGLTFAKASAGMQYACALTPAGAAYCWGSNTLGKLGNGGAGDRSSPGIVTGGLTFASISAGANHACGVGTDGYAYCWGGNGNGELGHAGANTTTVPTRVTGNLKAADVAAAGIATGSGAHSCAISADRLTVYCWGRNDTGQLGNGSTTGATIVNATPSIVVSQKPQP